MIATRSYMSIEPVELWLDTRALRRGLVYPIDPESEGPGLLIQDSGMVPVSTQITIVNPETNRLCLNGEYGEIWVNSEACVNTFYGSKDAFDAERFGARTVDGDPNMTYVRTGDLGFLHYVTRPIGPNGQQVDMQVLFVLGAIGETFEVNGLSHFPMDIEASVEKCHRNIVPTGCAVFQAGGLVVVLVEVVRKAYLASIVPVIVNTILGEHQLVIDIVAFVGKGDFPRSRLNEKQRGKILASWVTRKMPTIAQFGIRDADGADSAITAVPEERIVGPSSLRQSSIAATEPLPSGPVPVPVNDPSFAAEAKVPYESSIIESPLALNDPSKMLELAHATNPVGEYFPGDDQHQQLPHQQQQDYGYGQDGYVDYFAQDVPVHDPEQTPQPASFQIPELQHSGGLGDFNYDLPGPPPAPREGSKPILGHDNTMAQGNGLHNLSDYAAGSGMAAPGEYSAYDPSVGQQGGYQQGGYSGHSRHRSQASYTSREEEWPEEALMAMRSHSRGQ
jgi:hypothetical protein